jgi:hypothetical protein
MKIVTMRNPRLRDKYHKRIVYNPIPLKFVIIKVANIRPVVQW